MDLVVALDARSDALGRRRASVPGQHVRLDRRWRSPIISHGGGLSRDDARQVGGARNGQKSAETSCTPARSRDIQARSRRGPVLRSSRGASARARDALLRAAARLRRAGVGRCSTSLDSSARLDVRAIAGDGLLRSPPAARPAQPAASTAGDAAILQYTFTKGVGGLRRRPVEELALDRVVGQLERARVGGGRLVAAVEPAQQVGPRGVEEVVAVEARAPSTSASPASGPSRSPPRPRG